MNAQRLGSILWVASLQYFVVQVFVALRYQGDFSWLTNTISDLGNTACGPYGDRFVCSPDHLLMNLSFITVGVTQLLGALLLCRAGGSRKALFGYGCMMLAGLGTIIVGLFPENSPGPMHAYGAALPFLVGNIGLLTLTRVLSLPGWLKYYGYASGCTALAALVLFMTKQYGPLGLGGMERVVAYPQTVWMIVVGGYFCVKRP